MVRARLKQGYTERLGLVVPAAHVAETQRLAEQAQAVRERCRAASARARARAEARYREQFEQAIPKYLVFHPAHAELANEIARGATQHVAVVGSGRLGRSCQLPLAKRAELAARTPAFGYPYTRHETDLQPSGAITTTWAS